MSAAEHTRQPPTDPDPVRGVQMWMALDLWMGLDRDPAQFARPAGEDWAQVWAEEIHSVRQFRQQRDAALALADGWITDLSQEPLDDHGRVVHAVTKDHVRDLRQALGAETQ
jgi:hypothetical protein